MYRESVRFESRTRRDFEVWDHIATTQDKSNNPKNQCTKAESEALWSGWMIADADKTGRAAALQKSPDYSYGTVSRWRKTQLRKTKETLDVEKTNC